MPLAAAPLPPLESLLEILDLLVAQARTYEVSLPANNYPARAAVTVLGQLALKAQSEALTLAEALTALASLTPPPPAQPLTPRERQVLELVAHGLTNKEIGLRLSISERTVQYHLNGIFNKTTTDSRTAAAALALQKGWIGMGWSGES
jgi:DNA-binding NarL/FixJ family response regulator